MLYDNLTVHMYTGLITTVYISLSQLSYLALLLNQAYNQNYAHAETYVANRLYKVRIVVDFLLIINVHIITAVYIELITCCIHTYVQMITIQKVIACAGAKCSIILCTKGQVSLLCWHCMHLMLLLLIPQLCQHM